MRIAVICEYFYPDNSGGTPTDLSELTRWLKDRHGEVSIDVVTSRNLYRSTGISDRLQAQEDWRGVHIARLRVPKSNRTSMFLRLVTGAAFSSLALGRLIFRRPYDMVVIVTNPPSNAMAAWIYAKLYGVPYIYIVHDLYPDIAVALGKLRAKNGATRLFHVLQKQWLRGATKIVVLGRCMQRHLNLSYGIGLERITVIPSWGNSSAIVPFNSTAQFRARHGLAGFIILYGGNFSNYVDFDQMFEAARLLKDRSDAVFVLIGDGVRRKELMEKVAREGLSNIRILERVSREEMTVVLAACDVALISLDRRMLGLGVPSKLYSILAAGRAVIAMVPSQCEVAHVLLEENCGLVVSNCNALVHGILRLRTEAGLVTEMGLRARSVLEVRFTLEHAGEQFYRLLQGVIGRN